MNRFYFDHNATTPVSPEALDAYVSAARDGFGNASSIHHYGQAAKQKLEAARRQVAEAINCHPKEIVFVSGGTEADNLALLGAVRSCDWKQRHVITTAIEHPAVLNPCARLEREGVRVTYVQVGSDGVVDPGEIRGSLRPETILISVMHANNELGTIQPVEEIAGIAREAGVLFHSDGVQALGRIPVDVKALEVDLYSLSSHKVFAPKGAGVLYVRKGVRLEPLLYGGHHERDLRPGTENVPAAAAFGVACDYLRREAGVEAERLRTLRDRLEKGILERVPVVRVNGSVEKRLPNTSNLCFEGLEGEAMVIGLDLRGCAVSTGAACSSGAVEPSHVLTAIGLPAEKAKASIRFSLGRGNTTEQVDTLIDAVAATAAHLRQLSPTWSVHA